MRDPLLVTLAAAILTIATRGLTVGIAQQAPAGDRASPEAELARIEDAVAGGQFEKVVPGLQTFVTDHPDSPRAHYDLGYVLFRAHQMGPSIKELSRSLQLNVDNAEAHKILGLDCSIVGRYDLAETELVAAERAQTRTRRRFTTFSAARTIRAASIRSPNVSMNPPCGLTRRT